MQGNPNQYISVLLTFGIFIIGLAAFVGGIKRKSNPFFWIKNYKSIYLKTPTHYILFGLATMLASGYFIVRTLVSAGFF